MRSGPIYPFIWIVPVAAAAGDHHSFLPAVYSTTLFPSSLQSLPLRHPPPPLSFNTPLLLTDGHFRLVFFPRLANALLTVDIPFDDGAG